MHKHSTIKSWVTVPVCLLTLEHYVEGVVALGEVVAKKEKFTQKNLTFDEAGGLGNLVERVVAPEGDSIKHKQYR